LALAALQSSAFAVTTLAPGRDDEVLEVLPAITRSRPAGNAVSSLAPVRNAGAAATQARQDIAVARQTGDTRYWGRAQAELAPWWDRADAPVEMAILQATVQQGRHEFAPSRKILVAALARSPDHAQGWLNLAALERLSGQYLASLKACDAVERAGQPLYAQACRLETLSLQGQHAAAARGFRSLLAQSANDDQRSWLLSLLAESEERSGHDETAADAYVRSLALGPDLYTAIAYSDLLLRTGKARQALRLLTPLPETDAVLLRRATAQRRLGDPGWSVLRATLRERAAELERRGDDATLHGRELALTSLWLDDDAVAALRVARRNLLLQHEPIDWWVALQSARKAGDAAAVSALTKAIQDTGLVDVRLLAAPKNAGR
jgi:hypothetical protein